MRMGRGGKQYAGLKVNVAVSPRPLQTLNIFLSQFLCLLPRGIERPPSRTPSAKKEVTPCAACHTAFRMSRLGKTIVLLAQGHRATGTETSLSQKWSARLVELGGNTVQQDLWPAQVSFWGSGDYLGMRQVMNNQL